MNGTLTLKDILMVCKNSYQSAFFTQKYFMISFSKIKFTEILGTVKLCQDLFQLDYYHVLIFDDDDDDDNDDDGLLLLYG